MCPQTPRESTARIENEALLAQPRPALSLYGKRILVVEDDDRLYHALKDALEDCGCEVFGSCVRLSGPLNTVPGSHLDAALIDIEPRAARALSVIVQDLTERGVPMLFITAQRRDELPRAFHPHRLLRKPFTEEELLEEMAQTLEAEQAD